MKSVREQVLLQFAPPARQGAPDDELGDALYALLRSRDDLDITVDGWTLFRVADESNDVLDAIGLMTLLPGGSVPIAIRVKSREGGFTWSARVGSRDPAWLALSDSKRWNLVYLYATGARDSAPWAWAEEYEGAAFGIDA